MKRLALLLATALAFGALALPAFAAEGEGEASAKVDPALQSQLTYTPKKPDIVITEDMRKASLSKVAAESSPMAALIAFGMFGVVVFTVAGGAVAYRRA